MPTSFRIRCTWLTCVVFSYVALSFAHNSKAVVKPLRSTKISSETAILMYIMAFLFKVNLASSDMFSGFSASNALSQSFKKRIPCILSFHKSKPVPSNRRISNRFFTSEEDDAIVAQ
ncbi:hypothetical protein KP509_23G018500 [Ceratopteris richardii]|uniref:Uncharacterized protein n=1 Tax=Ceratopteris richardii TaxID=49495 RepID=A0A8T2S0C6_CERRI|nr:hypothetical protein KP509_23G018500 [Ceratopteris richardii]